VTQRTTTPLSFSSTRNREIHADFTGGTITSDAGVLVLREADRNLGLIAALDRIIPDPRNPGLITHPQSTLLAQRIFGIAAGYEDLNDHQRLRDDPLWQVLTDHPGSDAHPQLASPPTLCRLENRISRRTLMQMATVLVDTFIASFAVPPEHLTLDLDATDIEIHGHQEQRFFHGYYDCYCFLPLYIFCGEQLLVAYLRPSCNDASLHTRAILKLLVARLRTTWPNVRITIRGDSGFCRWQLMRWCDHNDVRYILGKARNSVLERLAASLSGMVEDYHRADGRSYRAYEWCHYAAQSWDRERRVIIKAEYLGGSNSKSNPRFVVTNLPGDARELYEQVYCARGEMENRIKEQGQLFATRTSCHEFVANQFRVLLAAAAYVLMEHVRRVGLSGTELEHAEVRTIRLRLFKIGAWVQKTVRRIVVKMASSYVWIELFERVVERLTSRGPRVILSG
jgi:Transposase DDE domain group 1